MLLLVAGGAGAAFAGGTPVTVGGYDLGGRLVSGGTTEAWKVVVQ